MGAAKILKNILASAVPNAPIAVHPQLSGLIALAKFSMLKRAILEF